MEHDRQHRPHWAIHPFEDALTWIHETATLRTLAVRGITLVRAIPPLVDALEQLHGDEATPPLAQLPDLHQTRQEAELAERELDHNFPLLHSQGVIALWATLEAMHHNLLANWLMHVKGARELAEVRAIHIPAALERPVEEQDRWLYVVGKLEHRAGARQMEGVSRFEVLLDLFGLEGAVETRLRRDLLELQQIRDALVHRRGLADRKLLEICPWLEYPITSRINIHRDDFERYFASVADYITNLIYRVGRHFDSGFGRQD